MQRTERLLDAAAPGAVGIQLRARSRTGRALFALAERLRHVCAAAGAPLYINGRVDVALAIGADGVHLGRGAISVADARRLLGTGTFVSRSAHAVSEVEEAERDGADAVLLSPIFASPGKGEGRGTALIRDAVRCARTVRVLALGGVNASHARACAEAGAHGMAAIRAFFGDGDPAIELRVLLEVWPTPAP